MAGLRGGIPIPCLKVPAGPAVPATHTHTGTPMVFTSLNISLSPIAHLPKMLDGQDYGAVTEETQPYTDQDGACPAVSPDKASCAPHKHAPQACPVPRDYGYWYLEQTGLQA